MFRRFVVTAPDKPFGQIHGFDEPSRVVVRILVAQTMPECPGTAIVRVSKLRRYRPERTISDVSLCCPPAERGAVRLRGQRQMHNRLCKVEARLRKPDELDSLGRCGGDPKCMGISHSNILAGEDHQAPCDKARVFACLDEACHPVEAHVGI